MLEKNVQIKRFIGDFSIFVIYTKNLRYTSKNIYNLI